VVKYPLAGTYCIVIITPKMVGHDLARLEIVGQPALPLLQENPELYAAVEPHPRRRDHS
jgi:hypothetical protein